MEQKLLTHKQVSDSGNECTPPGVTPADLFDESQLGDVQKYLGIAANHTSSG